MKRSILKIEKNHVCKSFWQGKELWDKEREKTYKVSFFGLNIYERIDKYNPEFMNNLNDVGFKISS